jgi:hypothetical protein
MGGVSLTGLDSTAGVQAAWDAFMKDAEDQLTYLVGLWNAAGAGMKTAGDLATKFATIMEDAEKVTTVFTIWSDVQDLQTRLAAAQKLSGQDRMDELNAINASAADLYSSLLQIVQGINSVEGSIHKSIQQQIWENSYSQAGTDPARLGMINDQISSLMGGIGAQGTAADVQGSASEIQAQITRYLGMFKADDPNRARAVAEANAQLEQLDKATRARLEELKAQAKKDADDAKAIMDLTRDAFHDAQVSATQAIDALKGSVLAFKDVVDTKLIGWATEVTDRLGIVADAFLKALGDFTLALEGPATGTGKPGGGGPGPKIDDLTIAAGNGSLALGDFTAAVNAATYALTGGKAA